MVDGCFDGLMRLCSWLAGEGQRNVMATKLGVCVVDDLYKRVMERTVVGTLC